MHKSVSDFVKLHNFKEELAGYVGVELEFFILEYGKIQPIAPNILEKINYELDEWSGKSKKYLSFNCELSACKIGYRVGPIPLDDLTDTLAEIEKFLEYLEWRLKFFRLYCGIAEFAPLDIFPSDHYKKIAQRMPKDSLRAVCQSTELHVHIGMPDYESALRAYNRSVSQIDYLLYVGDESVGERHRLYCKVDSDPMPIPINIRDDEHIVTASSNCIDNSNNNYKYIRITEQGTIEFRMFDSTGDIQRIIDIAKLCHRICLE